MTEPRSTMNHSNEMPRPRVLLSVATSIDGFIDDTSPDRLLLSNPGDFDRVDAARAEADAVLLGAGAIRADNPRVVVKDRERLATRMAAGRSEHPLKVTVTKTGNLDPGLRWFHSGGRRLVYTTSKAAPGLRESVGDRAEIVDLGNRVEYAELLGDLKKRGVNRLMVEGGQQIHTGLLDGGLVDRIDLTIAPLLVGDGPRFVAGGRFPWAGDRRWGLVGQEIIGDVVVLHYSIDRSFGPPGEEETDRAWLGFAIDLAERCPPTSSAFSVGAVIVDRSGRVMATGYSRETDDTVHAEESAVAKIVDVVDPADLATATIYSSLEPCGRRASRPTPCANLIINSGIRRVVMAWSEPSDFVDRPEGIEVLRAAGIEVLTPTVDRDPNYRPRRFD